MTSPTPSERLPVNTSQTVESMRTGAHADPYVLQGTASIAVEKISLKHGGAFMVTDTRGDLPVSEQETGLFWHGLRFLRTCDLFLDGQVLTPLSHSISDEEGSCEIDLTNPYLVKTVGNAQDVQQGVVHVRRMLEIRGRRLTQTFSVTSYVSEPLEVMLALKLGADFSDLFEVRGMVRAARGQLAEPQFSTDGAFFSYRGLDQIERTTQVTFSPTATTISANAAFWRLPLHQGATRQVIITADLTERDPHGRSVWRAAAGHAAQRTADEDPWSESWPKAPAHTGALTETQATQHTQSAKTLQEAQGALTIPHLRIPEVSSNNVFFNRLLNRGLHDLVMMSTVTPDGLYPYGGIPWYVCPFGRDALITSLEFLPWFPEIARGTLSFQAAYQGEKEDNFTEEEPGKIFHEYRQSEMANCHEVPFIPYYGSVDATPLFLITLANYVRWTNDLDFLRQIWPHAEAAARWLLTYGDKDGDGFIEYHRFSEKGLINQGWKDSWDAISHRDGSYAQGPIALCEAQAYAYAAYLAMAELGRKMGRPDDEAKTWEQRATTLQANFVRRFWWEEEQTFYLALDGAKRPCEVVSSNAGQCLWPGIVPKELAEKLIERLLQEDMYTGWGIRTLSAHAARYNPMSYHNGSVWPHDNALIGLGCALYGHKDVANKLLGNLYGLSLSFEGARLPELFCGFTRHFGYSPTRYPVACVPQSWAAGAPFLLLAATLGFAPDAAEGRLNLRNPEVPDWLERIDVAGLKVGKRNGSLHFKRAPDGETEVILDKMSNLDTQVLPD